MPLIDPTYEDLGLTAPKSKIQEKQEKLNNNLHNKQVRILGYNDADTPVLDNGIGGLRSNPTTDAYYDSAETRHGSLPFAESKSQRSMDAQRLQASDAFKIPLEQVTDEHVIAVSDQNLRQQLFEDTRTADDANYTAKLVNPSIYNDGQVVPTDLSPTTYEGIGIADTLLQTDGKRTSDETGNRLLGSTVNPLTGINTVDEAALDPERNASLYRPGEVGNPTKTFEEYQEENKSTLDNVLNEIGQTVAGAAAGAGKGAIETADAVQELVTWGPQAIWNAMTGEDIDIDLIDDDSKKAIIKSVDDMVGYDRSKDEKSLEVIKKQIEDSEFDITDPTTYTNLVSEHGWEAVKEAVSNPSLTASMVTEIIGAGGALGAGTKVAGKVGTKVATKVAGESGEKVAAKIGEKLTLNRTKTIDDIKAIQTNTTLTAAEKTAEIAKARKKYTTSQKITDMLQGTAYTNADLAVRTNKDLEEFKNNNDGEDAGLLKTAQILGFNRIVSAMEVGALKMEAKVSDVASTGFTKLLDNVAVDTAAHLAKSVGVEAAQETVDSIVEQINQKVGSKDYEDKSIGDILQEASAEILTGTIAGGAGGFHAGALGSVKDSIGNKSTTPSVQGGVASEDTVESTGNAPTATIHSAETIENDIAGGSYTKEEHDSVRISSVENNIGVMEDLHKKGNTTGTILAGAQTAQIITNISDDTTRRETIEKYKDVLLAQKALVDKEHKDLWEELKTPEGAKAALAQVAEETKDLTDAQKEQLFTLYAEANDGIEQPVSRVDQGVKTNKGKKPKKVKTPKQEKIDKDNLDKIADAIKLPKKKKDYILARHQFIKKFDASQIKTKDVGTVKDEVLYNSKIGGVAYFANYIASRDTGDTEKATTEKAKFDKLYNNQTAKAQAMDITLARAELDAFGPAIKAELDSTMKAFEENGKDFTREQVLKSMIDSYNKNDKKVLKAVPSNTFSKSVTPLDVMQKMMHDIKNPDEEYTGGLWGLTKAIENEVRIMDDLIDTDSITKEAKEGSAEYKARTGDDTFSQKKVADTVSDISRLQEISKKWTADQVKSRNVRSKLGKVVNDADSILGEVKSALVNKIRSITGLKAKTDPKATSQVDTKVDTIVKAKTDANVYAREVLTRQLRLNTLDDRRAELQARLKEYHSSSKDNAVESTQKLIEAVKEALKQSSVDIDVAKNKLKTAELIFSDKITKYEELINPVEASLVTKTGGEKNSKKLRETVEKKAEALAELAIKKPDIEIAKAEKKKKRAKDLITKLRNRVGNPQAKAILADTIYSRSGEVVRNKGKSALPLDSTFTLTPSKTATSILGLEDVNDTDSTTYSKKGIKSLSKAIANPADFKDKEAAWKFKMIDSPSFSLIYDKAGKVNANVAAALQLSLEKLVSNNGGSMLYNDGDKVKAMLALSFTSQEIRKMFRQGNLPKYLADTVGRDVLKMLGMEQAPNTDAELFDRLKQDLGNVGILMGEEQGYFVRDKVSKDDFNAAKEKLSLPIIENQQDITIIKLNPKRYTEEGGYNKLASERIKLKPVIDSIEIAAEDGQGVMFDKPKVDRNRAVRRSDSAVTEEGKKGLASAEDSEFELNTNAFSRGLSKISANYTKDELLSKVGYVSDTKLEDLSFDGREEALARNYQINKEYEDLRAIYESINGETEANSLWFNWFFTRNGRLLMDSLNINPQNHPLLDRFLATPVSHTITLNKDPKTKVDKETLLGFKYSIAQAFGYKTDGKLPADTVKFADQVLEADPKVIEDALLDASVGKDDKVSIKGIDEDLKIEHLGHVLQGIQALHDYANPSKRVKLTISSENDAKTNGFALKQMQHPILKVDTEDSMARVGIFRQGGKRYDNVDAKGDGALTVFNEKGFKDAYQSTAVSTDLTSKVPSDIRENVPNADLDTLLVDAMPSILDETSKEVSSWGRNLFKDFFMQFNYAASVNSLIGNLADKLVVDMMQNGVFNKKDKDVSEGIVNLLAELGHTPKSVRESMKTASIHDLVVGEGKSLSKKGSKNVTEALSVVIKEMIAPGIEKSLNEKYGPFIAMNNAINGSMKVMFDLWNKDFESQLAKLNDEVKAHNKSEKANSTTNMKYVTREDIKRIEDNLKEKFPLIKAPFSDSLDDAVRIIDDKVVTAEDGKFPVPQTHTKDDKSRAIQLVLKKYKESYASGSVLPIHFTDGTIMSKVYAKFNGKFVGIHDALLAGADTIIPLTKYANETLFEVSSKYDIAGEVLESLTRGITEAFGKNPTKESIVKLTNKEEAAEIIEAYTTMVDMTKVSQDARAEFYKKGTEFKVQNFVGAPGTMAVVKADGKNINKIVPTIDSIYGKTDVDNTTTAPEKGRKPTIAKSTDNSKYTLTQAKEDNSELIRLVENSDYDYTLNTIDAKFATGEISTPAKFKAELEYLVKTFKLKKPITKKEDTFKSLVNESYGIIEEMNKENKSTNVGKLLGNILSNLEDCK